MQDNNINNSGYINKHLQNNENILTVYSNNLENYFAKNVKTIDQFNFGFLIEFLHNNDLINKKCIILSYNSDLYYGLYNESLNKYFFPISDSNCDFYKFLSIKK